MPSLQTLWQDACSHLRQIIHADTYSRWFAIIEPISLKDDEITLAVDNDYLQTWIEENYLSLIQDALLSAGAAESIKISFAVKAREPVVEPALKKAPAAKQRTKAARGRRMPAPNLNAKYTFNDFVVGSCNSFAHAAAKAVAKSPGTAYNPLFIYGETALGKTHLMQAVGHEVGSKFPDANVCYTSTEDMLNEYINALQQSKTVEFRRRYRHADVLLVDDVHFLVGKKGLQEEFFHTFNTLHNARKQIIMCSDRPANELQGLEQRLVSRFEWGLVTSLERPDFETRMAILRDKQSSAKVKLSDELLTFIAENVTSNVRGLEGALIRAVTFTSLMGEEQTVDSLRHLLRDVLEQEIQPDLTAQKIQKVVAEHFDIRVADMTSKRRPQSLAVPRQVAMFLCRRFTRSSLPEIGAQFEKSHATVLHAYRTIRDRIDTDPELHARIQTCARRLGRDPHGLLKD